MSAARTEVTYSGQLAVTSALTDGQQHDEVVAIAFERIMDHLISVVDDPMVSGSASSGTFQIGIVVLAESRDAAFSTADPLVRGALHAAGVWTPTWDDDNERAMRFLTANFYKFESETETEAHLVKA